MSGGCGFMHVSVAHVTSYYRSYGVLLWEIMTLGRTPYPGIDNRDVLKEIEENNLRLSEPKDCPKSM